MLEPMEHVQVGDKVVVSRGRSRDQLRHVYHVTPRQFSVEGFGKFWKKNGKGVGDANSWYGSYARVPAHGDAARIKAEDRRIKNRSLFNECRVRDFNDDELEAVAKVIRAMNARHEAERKQYDDANKAIA